MTAAGKKSNPVNLFPFSIIVFQPCLEFFCGRPVPSIAIFTNAVVCCAANSALSADGLLV
jgi:hypothetical protein